MSLVPSLLQAILRVDGEALVMHAGDKPYVVSPTGQIELASRGLTLDALNTIVGQLLPTELQLALDEFGAVQYELPAAEEFPGQHFTVVAARGGDDVWTEIRRRRVPDDDHVPEELFEPSGSAFAAAPPVLLPPAAAPAFAHSDADDLSAETLGFIDATEQTPEEEDDVLLMPDATQLWPEQARSVEVNVGSPALRPVDKLWAAPSPVEGREPQGIPSDLSSVKPRDERPVLHETDGAQSQQPSEGVFDIDIDVDADVALEPPPPVWQPPPPAQPVVELRSPPPAPPQPVADVRPPLPPPRPVAALPSQPDVVLPLQPGAVLPLPPAAVLPSEIWLETEREVVKLKNEAGGLLDAVRAQVDTLGVKKKEFEAFDERLRTLQAGVGDAESRMVGITARDEELTELTQKVDGLSKRFETLFTQADDLAKKQLALEPLHERAGHADDLAKKTTSQLESLRQSREELDVLRKEIQKFSKTHADAARLAAKLDADRLGLEAFGERMTALATLVPELEAKMDAITGKLEGAKFNQAAIIEQDKRYGELAAAGKTVAAKVSEHSRQMQALAAELARSSKMKDEILAELDRVQSRQRDATSQIQTSQDQLARAENMFKQLEARRSQVAFDEKKPEVVLPSQPVAVLPSAPAVVLPISRNPIRSGQPPPSVSDPTLSGLERLLRVSSARGASTLYLSSESRPSVRVDGELQMLDGEPVHVARDVESLLLTLMPERSHEALRTGGATEWICDIEGVGRVRCMSFRDHRGPGGVFRLMPTRSISAEQLGLPVQVQALALEPEGIVLVAGPRSSGKRTLISAFVDLMNRTRRDHVITIEREINIVHERLNSFISQREMRGDDDEMLAAARSALREDPDVLVIEDLRTGALMNVALEAAAAGRLVIGGFSAHTATGAIDRIIDLYAPEYRRQVQLALADSLRGVIVQVLLRKIGGGRLPAREVLLNTPAVSSAIAEGKTSQLPMAIEGGRRHGMMPLNDALVGLVQSGAVEAHEAYRRSADRPGFLAALDRQGIDTSFVERLA